MRKPAKDRNIKREKQPGRGNSTRRAPITDAPVLKFPINPKKTKVQKLKPQSNERLTRTSPKLRANPYLYLHKQEFEVEFQSGKKLVEEAIAFASGGSTKVPWQFFRRALGEKQKGCNSRRFYLMPGGERFHFSTTEAADGREDLRLVLKALIQRLIATKFMVWAFIIPKFDEWAESVATELVDDIRFRAPLKRFELYKLIPRDEVATVAERIVWLQKNEGFKNPFRRNHFHGAISLGGHKAELYCYHVDIKKYPQDFAKLEISFDVKGKSAIKNLVVLGGNELERLCEGITVVENPPERTGIAIYGGRYLKEELNVTYELRGGVRALRKQRKKRMKVPLCKEPNAHVTTGIKVLDQAFGPRGVSPGLYRFVLAEGSDYLSVKIHQAVQHVVDTGHTAVCVIEGALPWITGPENRLALFSTYKRKQNNHVDRSATERMIDWWLASETKPTLLYVELMSAPLRDDFWNGLGARTKRAGVPLFLVYPCEIKRRNFLDSDLFCLRVDELVRESHTATRSYVSVCDFSHVTIELNTKTGRKAHSLRKHELRFHPEDTDVPGWCPRRVPTVRFNPSLEYKGLLL